MIGSEAEAAGECYDPADPCLIILALPFSLKDIIDGQVQIIEDICADDRFYA